MIAAGFSDRVGASATATIAVLADIGLAGDIAQWVVLDGLGLLAGDLVVGEAVEAVVVKAFIEVFIARLFAARAEIAHRIPLIAEVLDITSYAKVAGGLNTGDAPGLGKEKSRSIYLMQLFPPSPARVASKIAGLPRPENCL